MDVGLSGSRRRNLVMLIAVSVFSGCGLITQIGYWSGGSIREPEYEGLEGHRVAIVAVSDASSYGGGIEAEQLARQVRSMLRQNIEEIDLVHSSEVADWIDKNGWDQIDYRQVGKGVKAERVVAIDLEGFRLHQGANLYKGRASVTVTVFDLTRNGSPEVFRREIMELTYPSTGVLHASDTRETVFQKLFIEMIARRVAVLFYPYDELDLFGPEPVIVQ